MGSEMCIRDSLKSDGAGRDYLNMKAGGSVNPSTHETVDAKEHYIYQDGKTVFKFAVTNMADVSAEIMERNNLKGDDVAWLVPHQANKRIIDATARRMGVGSEKVMLNIDKYGNTTNGTIPLCLWEWEDKLKKGDNLVLAAFGGGFTWGSIYLKRAYKKKKVTLITVMALDIQVLQELIKCVATSGVSEVDLEMGEMKISIKTPPKKGKGQIETVVQQIPVAAAPSITPVAVQSAPVVAAVPEVSLW